MKPIRFFVGTYTRDNLSKGIYTLEYNPSAKSLKITSSITNGKDPTFLALHKNYLYSVGENQEGGFTSSFSVDDNGQLALINSVKTLSSRDCHVAVNNDFLYTSSYHSGSLFGCKLSSNGSLGAQSYYIQHKGDHSSHIHSAVFTPDNRFLLVADLGLDRLYIYQINSDGSLLPNPKQPFVQFDIGEGPRHMTFDSQGTMLYLACELSCNVKAMSYNRESGTLAVTQSISLLKDPVGSTIINSAADIHISPNNRHLYASVRGVNQLIHYVIEDKRLIFSESTSCLGDWPRNFAISPNGVYIIIANERSNDIFVCKLDPMSGRIGESICRLDIPAPVCVIIDKRST